MKGRQYTTAEIDQATLRFLEHPEHYAKLLKLEPGHALVTAANQFHQQVEEALQAPIDSTDKSLHTTVQQRIHQKIAELRRQYRRQQEILALATQLGRLSMEHAKGQAALEGSSEASDVTTGSWLNFSWLWSNQQTDQLSEPQQESRQEDENNQGAMQRAQEILTQLEQLDVNIDSATPKEGQTESSLLQETETKLADLQLHINELEEDFDSANRAALATHSQASGFATAAKDVSEGETQACTTVQAHLDQHPQQVAALLASRLPLELTPQTHHARSALTPNANELLVADFENIILQERLPEETFNALLTHFDIREALKLKLNYRLGLTAEHGVSDKFLDLFLQNENRRTVIAFLYEAEGTPNPHPLSTQEAKLQTYLLKHSSPTHKAAHWILSIPTFMMLPNRLQLIGALCQERVEHKSFQRKFYGFFRHDKRQRSYEALAALQHENGGLNKVLMEIGAQKEMSCYTYHAITFAQLGMQCGLQRFLRHTHIKDPVDIFQIYLDGGINAIADEVIYQLDACREQGVTDPEQLQRIAQTYLEYMVAVHPHAAMVKPVVAANRQMMTAKIAEYLKPDERTLLAPGKSILRKASLKVVKPYKTQPTREVPEPYLNAYVDEEPDPTKAVPVHPGRHTLFKKKAQFAEEASTASYSAYHVETIPQEQLGMREARAEIKPLFEAIDRGENPQEDKQEGYEILEQQEAAFIDYQNSPAQLEAARHYLQAHPRWASKSQYLKDAFIKKFEKADGNEQKLMAALEAIRFFASLKGHYADALLFVDKISQLTIPSLTSSTILDSRFQKISQDLRDNKKYHKFASSARATGVERLYQLERREDLSTPVKLLTMSAVAHGRSQIESLGRSSETKALYDRLSRFDEMPVSRRIESLLDTDMTSLVGPTDAQAEDDDPRYDPKLVLNALYHQRYLPSTKNTLPYYSFTFVNQRGKKEKANGFSVFARIAANPELTNKEKILNMIIRGHALYPHDLKNDVLRKLAECALPRDENDRLQEFQARFPATTAAPRDGGFQATI